MKDSTNQPEENQIVSAQSHIGVRSIAGKQVSSIETVIRYVDGSERRNMVHVDPETSTAIIPALPTAAQNEWNRINAWLSAHGLHDIVSPTALRDHCMEVNGGKGPPTLPNA